MPIPLRVLILEDNPSDAELMLHALRRAGYDPAADRVETEEDYRDRLRTAPEVILSDFCMPEFEGLRALEIMQEAKLDIPFILVSGSIGDERAVQVMQRGATDYVLKDRLGRLGQAVAHSLEKKHLRDEALLADRRLLTQHAVTQALAESPTLATATGTMLRAICGSIDWVFGAVWQVDPQENVLRCIDCWHNPLAWVADFEALTRQTAFASNSSLPGRVWASGQPAWVADFASDPTFPRAACAARVGLHAAFAIPITLGTETLGILEFFHRDIKRQDDDKLKMMMGIGSQLAQYIDRKRSEASLRRSEERYRTLITATAAIVWDSSASGAFDSDQPAWTAFTGQTIDEHKGWGWLDVIHPDDREMTARAWSAAVKARATYQVEHRLRRADGQYRQMSARAVPITEPDGTIREWVGVHTDVTDQKRAEDDLRLFRALIDRTTDAIEVVDPVTGRFLDVNDRACVAHGYTRDEYLALSVADIDAGVSARPWCEVMATIGSVLGRTFESRHRRKDGSTFPVEINLNSIHLDREYMVAVVRDTTERNRTEEAMRLRDRVIGAATQGILITDAGRPDDPIVYVSPGFERITGYGSDEVLGRNCRFLQGKDTDPAAVAQIREALRAEEPCTVELLNYRKDGTPFWNELSLSPIRDDAGRLTHFVGFQVDVTARRSLEEQFRQAQKMDAVGRLAGGIAHDFNNLLTIINGYSDLLLQSLPPGDPSRDSITEILKAGERSAGLTRQLLAFSRQQVMTPVVLDLNAVVTDTEKMLRRLVGEDVRLTTTLLPMLGPVRADPGQIEQVLMNLVVNARDAMPRGGRLTIETRNVELDATYARSHRDSRSGHHVLLSITDTGGGMTPEVQARLFEPFFTTKEKGKGTGLGLATVYGIVKQSGGHLAVYSEVGVGTTFKVYLPQVGQAAAGAKGRSGALVAPRGTETVLLVEDEDGVRALTRHVLTGCGYTVLEAADGDEAVRVAAQHAGPIRLLVTDVVMPGLGGRAVAEEMVKRHPGVQVLFVSGYTDDAVIRHGVLAEGVNFLQKPFSPIALAFKVREILDASAKCVGR